MYSPYLQANEKRKNYSEWLFPMKGYGGVLQSYLVVVSIGVKIMDHRVWVIGNQLIMTSYIRDEIWAWKGIRGRKKQVGLIPLVIFWVVWKKRNRRAFKGVEADFDRVKDRWFQIWDLLTTGHSLQSMNDFKNLIDILL